MFENSKNLYYSVYNDLINWQNKKLSRLRLGIKLINKTISNAYTFNYNCALSRLLAVQNFINESIGGFVYDPKDIDLWIGSLDYKFYDLENLLGVNFDVISSASKKLAIDLLVNRKKLTFKHIVVKFGKPSFFKFFLFKRVLMVDENTQTGFFVRRNRFKLLNCFRVLFKTLKLVFSVDLNNEAEAHKEIKNVARYKFSDEQVSLVDQNKSVYKKTMYKRILNEDKAVTIVKNGITIFSYNPLGISGNCKYVLNKIVLDEYFSNKKINLITVNKNGLDSLPSNIKLISFKENRDEAIKALFDCKVLIYDDLLPPEFKRSPNQILINLWHGAINYKYIGLDCDFYVTKHFKELFKLKNPTPNYFVAGTNQFIDSCSAGFNLPKNIFLNCGLPRNDLFFDENLVKQAKAKVKNFYKGSDGKKIVLYCPTFRNAKLGQLHSLNINELLAKLDEKFGGEFVLFYRGHQFTRSIQNETQKLINVSSYADQQEILCATDVLISDYSSILFDGIFLNIPSFVYAPDYEDYKLYERDLLIPFEKMPYSFAKTNSELFENIMNFDMTNYIEKTKKHKEEVISFDNGSASLKIIELIKGVLK